MAGHDLADLLVGFPADTGDEEAEETAKEQALDVRGLDARRLDVDQAAEHRRAGRDRVALHVGQHRLAELGLEVVVPAEGNVLSNVGVVASGVEERLRTQQPELHIGQRRPVVVHLVLEAAGHLARVHTLSIRPRAGVETDRQPSPRALARLRALGW